MGTRLALVACKASNEGPWTSACGNETALKVTDLGKGEHVILSMEIGELKESVTYYANGVYPLPWKRVERYKVSKHVPDGVRAFPTTVEIILDG